MDSIIFDLDGTLWNSTDIVADAWRRFPFAMLMSTGSVRGGALESIATIDDVG